MRAWLLLLARANHRPGQIEQARLYGNIDEYAYYFVNLLVGSPLAQRVSPIIDTGSSVTAFPCVQCGAACGHDYHIDPPFDFARSSSAAWVPCAGCSRCDGARCSY
jgi:hypothetical protein